MGIGRGGPDAPSRFVNLVFLGAAAMLLTGLAGSAAYDLIRRETLRPRTLAQWPPARQAVAARLKQAEPLEFGAVWATHSGAICGLVNGWGSFGGLTGMTPFVADGRRTVFALDVGPLQFAPLWRNCMTDRWITLVDGSAETGFCATRRGRLRCPTVGG